VIPAEAGAHMGLLGALVRQPHFAS